MGDVEKLKRELAAQRAPEPRYQGLREAMEKLHHWTYEASNETVVLVKLSDVLERLAAAEPREGDDAAKK